MQGEVQSLIDRELWWRSRASLELSVSRTVAAYLSSIPVKLLTPRVQFVDYLTEDNTSVLPLDHVEIREKEASVVLSFAKLQWVKV